MTYIYRQIYVWCECVFVSFTPSLYVYCRWYVCYFSYCTKINTDKTSAKLHESRLQLVILTLIFDVWCCFSFDIVVYLFCRSSIYDMFFVWLYSGFLFFVSLTFFWMFLLRFFASCLDVQLQIEIHANYNLNWETKRISLELNTILTETYTSHDNMTIECSWNYKFMLSE